MSLTTGVIEKIFNIKENSQLPVQPVLQVLNVRPVSKKSDQKKLRAVLSDGKYFSGDVILGTVCTKMYQNGDIYNMCLIKLVKYLLGDSEDRKFIMVVELAVVNPDQQINTQLGDPIEYSNKRGGQSKRTVDNVSSGKSTTTYSSGSNAPTHGSGGFESKETTYASSNDYGRSAKERENVAPPTTRPQPSMNNLQKPSFGEAYGKRTSSASTYASSDDVVIVPINALTPYQTKWTIRAVVTNKSTVRAWKNSRGEGKLFSVTFSDESGEIRATAFNDSVDMFYEQLEMGKAFYVSNAVLKVANKQYSSVQNEYEMTFGPDTVVKPCSNHVAVPSKTYNFVQISKIVDCAKNTTIDVIGVVATSGDVTYVNSKTTSKQLCKRDISLVDTSATSVVLTLWGDNATSDEYCDTGSVLVLKSAKVCDFNGKSLTLVGSTSVEKNPDMPEVRDLFNWYKTNQSSIELKPLQNSTMSLNKLDEPYKFLYEIPTQDVTTERFGFINVCVMIENIKADNVVYRSCPTPNCYKKVIEDGPSSYRCEKCNKVFGSYLPRLILTVKLVDQTSSQWIKVFNEDAEKLTESTAHEIDAASQNNRMLFDDILGRPRFKRFIFRLKLKLDTYNDETRIRADSSGFRQVDFITDGRHLINRIKQLSAS